jgi:hypothetical protein
MGSRRLQTFIVIDGTHQELTFVVVVYQLKSRCQNEIRR